MDDDRIMITFALEVRRKLMDDSFSPWRITYVGTKDEVFLEREAHIMSGYDLDSVRMLKIIRTEEVWNP